MQILSVCICILVFGISSFTFSLLAQQRFPEQPAPHQLYVEDSLRQHLKQAKDTTRVKILNSLAWMFRGTDFVRAMSYTQEAARDVALLGYPRVRAETNNYTGIIYRNLGNYARAMACFLEALSIAENYGYKREEGFALNNIGDVYKYQGNYTEARAFVMRSLALFEQLHESEGLYYCHIRLGEIAQKLHEDSLALRSFQNALQYSNSMDNLTWKAGALNRIGQVYRETGRYSLALLAFSEALEISTALPNDEDEQAFILVQMGKTHAEQKNYPLAEEYLRRGFVLAERIGLKLHLREAAKILTQIFTTKQDYAQALHFQTVQMAMSDSLYNESSSREIEKIIAKYELEQQQNAIDALNASQRQERVIVVVLAGSVLLLVLIAILLYRNARSKQRTNAEILRQQEILEEQSAEIEISNTALHEQNSTLAALNLEKTEIMAIVAHDLKNPIGAVRGLADLVHTGFASPEKVLIITGQIVSTADRMLELVKNLLDVNQLESGGRQFERIEFDVAPLVESTIWQYQSQAEAKNITLHYSAEAASNLVIADEQAMVQVLDNIVSNAVKYSPFGKNVFVRVKPSNGKVRVEVQDEANGISPEDMTKLFGKFARLSSRPTGGEHSTGLGLSIVKKMVVAMNGKVWCESVLGEGATFIVELPHQ
jgi:signal transduction histidine kinase